MKAKDLGDHSKAGAGCLFWDLEDEKFLLIKRSEYVPLPNTWTLPGGRLDPGETPIEAVRREVVEEIGFEIGKRPLRLIYTNETHAPRFRFFTYACLLKNKFEPRLNWESTDYMWCDMSDLPDDLHWGVKQMVSNDRAARLLKRFINSYKREE